MIVAISDLDAAKADTRPDWPFTVTSTATFHRSR